MTIINRLNNLTVRRQNDYFGQLVDEIIDVAINGGSYQNVFYRGGSNHGLYLIQDAKVRVGGKRRGGELNGEKRRLFSNNLANLIAAREPVIHDFSQLKVLRNSLIVCLAEVIKPWLKHDGETRISHIKFNVKKAELRNTTFDRNNKHSFWNRLKSEIHHVCNKFETTFENNSYINSYTTAFRELEAAKKDLKAKEELMRICESMNVVKLKTRICDESIPEIQSKFNNNNNDNSLFNDNYQNRDVSDANNHEQNDQDSDDESINIAIDNSIKGIPLQEYANRTVVEGINKDFYHGSIQRSVSDNNIQYKSNRKSVSIGTFNIFKKQSTNSEEKECLLINKKQQARNNFNHQDNRKVTVFNDDVPTSLFGGK